MAKEHAVKKSLKEDSTNCILLPLVLIFNSKKTIFAWLSLSSIFLTVLFWIYLFRENELLEKAGCHYDCGLPVSYIRYLINTSTCNIPDLGAFNEQAMQYHEVLQTVPCTKTGHLTYVERKDDHYLLHTNDTLLASSSIFPISCCYSKINRLKIKGGYSDSYVWYSECRFFTKKAKIHDDFIRVKCSTIFQTIYINVYALFQKTNSVIEKINHFKNTSKTTLRKNQTFGVTMIGIDSVSNYNFERTMPQTFLFVEKNFLSLKGYVKIGDNTYPNLLGILSGYTYQHIYLLCNPPSKPMVNSYLIWHYFSEAGYITAYAEDWPALSTFNYGRKGFNEPPTDYYLRPYFLAADKYMKKRVDDVIVCTGPETTYGRMYNIIEDFCNSYQDIPTFSLFWMTSVTHENVNGASIMDNETAALLERLKTSGAVKNNFVIFFSDHGFRFGTFRNSYAGWLEERMPFIYILFPDKFKELYPEKYKNFLINTQRLTTPYDLYMTFQEILSLADRKYVVRTSSACEQCHSLFSVVPENRTCQDAAISNNWCPCKEYKTISRDLPVVKKAEAYAIKTLNDLIKKLSQGANKCSTYTHFKTISVSVADYENEEEKFLVLNFRTKPIADFEITLSVYNFSLSFSTSIKPSFTVEGEISRTDKYGSTSACVRGTNLEKYCYCKK